MIHKRPFVLGLTGSIGMGKSTTAGFFADLGIPVWDADAAVHRLYSKGGAAVEAISQLHPAATIDGSVDRNALKTWISNDPTAIKQIEEIVHPLVAQDRKRFFEHEAEKGTRVVVVDVPLLFETGGDRQVDATLVVTISPEIQKARVLARKGMTQAHFERILASQMPDAEKREVADYVIETDTVENVKAAVKALVETLRKKARLNA